MSIETSESKKVYRPLTDIDSVLSMLDKITIFGGLSEKQLYVLFKLLEKVSYESGEEIFKQGDKPSHIYIIQKGSVKMIVDVDDTPFELVVFGAGHCLEILQ